MGTTDLADIAWGDSDDLTLTITASGGGAQDITGFKIAFSLKRNLDDEDAPAVWRGNNASLGGVTVTNAPGGIAKVAIPKGTTSGHGDRTLFYDVAVWDAAGKRFTERKGKYPVVKTATATTTVPT